MSTWAHDAAQMIDMLPESEQKMAFDFIRKLVLSWDPDFTKLTPNEARELREAENGEFIADSEIDWDLIGK